MRLFHLLTATITLTIASGGKETESRSLRLFLDEHLQQSNSKNRNGNDIINLPNGIFSSCGYPVISRTLTLEGMKTELHISAKRNTHETETENGIDSSSTDEDWQLSMFRIRNSTVSLTSLCLNSEVLSSLIASVSSSFVTVSESDIRSNGMNSPFVMLTGMGDGQSCDIGSCLDVWNCRHISSSLVSLVPIAEFSRKSDHTVNAGKGWTDIEETKYFEEIRISASELSISDCCLTFGTGPLIGFESGTDKTERCDEHAALPWKVSSQLISSCVMNTTSTASNVKVDGLEGMELTQVVTGSRVCSCTNHLYGTACADMNANVLGSLLSLNTSFWSCLTDTPTHLSQHFTTQQELTQSTSFKLCTFKDCTSSSNGGAINLDKTGSLLIEDCSFKTCTADSYGGAIFYAGSTGASFVATSSSFVGCSTGYISGSIFLIYAPSATMLNCVFVDSTSKSHGGCISIHAWDAVSTSSSITDCLFENCRTTYTDQNNPFSGGALYIVSTVSVQLNFDTFRGNKAAQNPGNDIMFAGKTPLITSETIVGCTSTSDSPRVRVYEETEGTDDHLPNPTTTAFLVSCVGTSFDDDTAKFTLKMSEPITGTVLVLIDNSGGTRTPTSEQAPNIERVLSFSFDDTDESSCLVPLGESGLVQEPLSEYSNVTSSFVGSVVLSASCALDESEENAFLTLSGSGIPSGILSVTLSDNTVIAFEFRPQQTTSEVLTVSLTEISPKLGYGRTYTIVSAQSQTQPGHPITVPFLIEIIVPDQPLLTTIGVGEGGKDDAAGTMDDPFKTLHRCFLETAQSDESFAVFVIERARIGERCWLADQPGWSMEVSGSGSGGLFQSEVLCSVSDEEKQPGTSSSSTRHAMITLSAQSLSFFDILFSSFGGPRWMGFVFSLLGSSQLTLSSCSLSSLSPVAVSLVLASASSSFSASSLSMRDVSFVGKAGLVKFVDASRVSLTSCSFSSISLEGGALLWGTSRGGIDVQNSEFSSFNGEEFGCVIRVEIVGITALITNCSFTRCSTRVRMGEKGSRRVVGGGCVVVEMLTRTVATRHLRSSSVDLSLSSFSNCTLSNTDGSLSEEWLSSFVGGSGFLIFGNSRTDSAIVQKVRVSGCVCVGFGKSGGFDGGVVVGLGFALLTDRRGSCVVDSGMGSIELR